ncbi:MAG: helix-turn-helix domain-containing protein [Candidatus Omnitrophica bacterium]|jgi:sugar-specific transcriptional regulator TrmB|nr:helix-turn-helix domain-containing protein [Candidatus Omnitrophota bacterium]
MAKINEILGAFSLSDVESRIYLSALGMEKPAVAQIAKKINMNRTATYHHINHLLEKGFLKQTRKGRVVQLVAVPPSEVAERFDRLSTDFRSLVPQLESLKKISRETPVIEIKESRQGYAEVYEELSSLPEGAMFRVLEGAAAMKKELHLLTEKELNKFYNRVVERKIVTRAIFTSESINFVYSELSPSNLDILKKRIWQLKTISESQLPFGQLMFVYGEKIAFMFPESSLVMTIKHKGIADAMAAMFEGLNSFAKPIERLWERK